VKPELLKSWSLEIDYLELRVLALTKRYVGSGNEIEACFVGFTSRKNKIKNVKVKFSSNLYFFELIAFQNIF